MDGYLGQVVLFAGTYAPKNWALCNGQLLSINQNMALYSIVGAAFGGDAKTTFALPDLRSVQPTGMSYIICITGTFPMRMT